MNEFILPTAADKQAINTALAKLDGLRGSGVTNSGSTISISQTGDNGSAGTSIPRPYLVAVIVAAGPSGESDFTDNRYWVEFNYIKYLTSSTWDTVSFPTGDIRKQIVAATNLAEEAGATHLLPVDGSQQVTVCMGYDSQNLQRYFFTLSPSFSATIEVCDDDDIDATGVTAMTFTSDCCVNSVKFDGDLVAAICQ